MVALAHIFITSVLNSHTTITLSYVLSTIHTNLVNFLKKMIKLLQNGALYTLTQIHFFLDIVNSDELISQICVL